MHIVSQARMDSLTVHSTVPARQWHDLKDQRFVIYLTNRDFLTVNYDES